VIYCGGVNGGVHTDAWRPVQVSPSLIYGFRAPHLQRLRFRHPKKRVDNIIMPEWRRPQAQRPTADKSRDLV